MDAEFGPWHAEAAPVRTGGHEMRTRAQCLLVGNGPDGDLSVFQHPISAFDALGSKEAAARRVPYEDCVELVFVHVALHGEQAFGVSGRGFLGHAVNFSMPIKDMVEALPSGVGHKKNVRWRAVHLRLWQAVPRSLTCWAIGEERALNEITQPGVC